MPDRAVVRSPLEHEERVDVCADALLKERAWGAGFKGHRCESLREGHVVGPKPPATAAREQHQSTISEHDVVLVATEDQEGDATSAHYRPTDAAVCDHFVIVERAIDYRHDPGITRLVGHGGRLPKGTRGSVRIMRVVVLGAGFGGLELTTRLSEEFGADVDVVLIDKSDDFVFGFSKLEVMFGRASSEEVRHPYRDVVKPGVRFVQSTIRAIDPNAKRVETDAGTFDADILVVALGADLHPEATPGLVEGGYEFYTVPGAFALRDVLADFDGGRVIVAVTSTPFKCPPAPSETALLMHDFLTDRGLRDGIAHLTRHAVAGSHPAVARRVAGAAGGVRGAGDRVVPARRWCAGSTRRARWRCSATVARCPTTSSSACRCTGCRTWSRNRA